MLKKIFKENPIFVLALGLCSALAVTDNFEKSYLMGLCVIFVLVFSNLIVSSIRKLVPESVKVPVYIIIIGTFVTILSLLLNKFVPNVYNSLGIYLSLITVNCLVLGRALSYASNNTVFKSVADGFGVGIGYTLALMLIGLIREILGNNSLTLINELSTLTNYRLIFKNILPISISVFKTPAGAFFTFGIILAIINVIRRKNESN